MHLLPRNYPRRGENEGTFPYKITQRAEITTIGKRNTPTGGKTREILSRFNLVHLSPENLSQDQAQAKTSSPPLSYNQEKEAIFTHPPIPPTGKKINTRREPHPTPIGQQHKPPNTCGSDCFR